MGREAKKHVKVRVRVDEVGKPSSNAKTYSKPYRNPTLNPPALNPRQSIA